MSGLRHRYGLATPVGLEPTTPGLEVQCSDPTELRGHRIPILTNLAAGRLSLHGAQDRKAANIRLRCQLGPLLATLACPTDERDYAQKQTRR
jgi:hypothetical protein